MSDKVERLILVVDDEPRMIKFIRMNLELEGYRVAEATDGLEAVDRVREDLPDLVVMDVQMPEMDGFEALKRIRQISTVPVIMLTVRADEDDKVRGLELGADDYVTKPFSPRELSSRIKALLRRLEMPSPPAKTVIQIDDRLTVDFQRHEVTVDAKIVKLRPTEYRLLYHLISNAGWIMSHEMLLSKVWGHEYRDESHLLRVYITYLRQKIEADPANPQYILTERGVGYRFVDLAQQREKNTTV